MFKGHPLFGVGVDRYAAYFLQYRDPKYPLIYGYTQTVTNAHNVFLQIFATAGIFVGFAYLFIIGFIAYRGFVALRQTSGNEQILIAAVISGWIVFVAQSVISVDSLVISIWGWVLGGSIVGLSLAKKEVVAPISGGKSHKNNRPKRVTRDYASPYRSITFVVFFTAISLIIVPMYRNETSTFRFSITQSPTDMASKDIYRSIAKKTFNLPLLNPNYKANIATMLAKNNYTSEAISYFKQTIKSDSRNTNAYLLLSLIYEHLKNPQEAISLRQQLVILDPYGAENLVSLEADYIAIGDKQAAVKTRNAILAIAPGTDVAKRAAALITN
jgi:tetratricopeptide (TPR) repeat protein